MPSPVIEIRGLKEIQERMQEYPQKLNAAIRKTMQAAILALWETVPPYPEPPEGSTYRRTGTLGRTLGSGESGGKASSTPDIYEVKKMGSAYEGRFGSSLEYAPYVIGDDTQAEVHRGRWWTMKVIAERATAKIDRLFEMLAEKLTAWLDGGKE